MGTIDGNFNRTIVGREPEWEGLRCIKWIFVWERERLCVREREGVCVRERECVCVCVCVCERDEINIVVERTRRRWGKRKTRSVCLCCLEQCFSNYLIWAHWQDIFPMWPEPISYLCHIIIWFIIKFQEFLSLVLQHIKRIILINTDRFYALSLLH